LRFGAAKRGSQVLTDRVEGLLSRISVEPFASPADEHYGELRAALETSGRPIGSNDLFIAAHALALR
jgi:tRNA(fMet)-specific endonuclease VapC